MIISPHNKHTCSLKRRWYLLLNLRSPRSCGSSCSRACMYVSHVLDRKLVERLMSPSPKSQVMFASTFSWIGDFFRIFGIHIFQVSKSALHYTKIGDAGGVPLQRCEPSEFGSAHYTKIGDAGVLRRGLWTSLGSGPRWEIGETMPNLTWRR